MMVRYKLLSLAMLLALVLPGCDDGHSAYDSDPYWSTECWTEWLADDSVLITVGFTEFDGYGNEEIRTGEFTLYTGPSKDGPWTKIDYQVWRSERIDNEFTYTLKPPRSSELTFFFVKSRFYVGSGLGAAYTGPLVATASPLMTPENWCVLPDLTTTVPFGSLGIWRSRYMASALSPDGGLLFIQNDMNRVYDLSNGMELRRYPLKSNEYEQGRSFWFDSGIYIQDYGLTVIHPWSLTKRMEIYGWYTFLRGDSTFVVMDDEKWYTYNIRTEKLDSIPAEFPLPLNNARKVTIAQSPSGGYYGANDWLNSYNNWRLYDSGMNVVRNLSPIEMAGLNSRRDAWFNYRSRLYLDMYWLSDDAVMMKTNWSGEEEFWCYRISTSTYYQITGRRMPPASIDGDYRVFYTRWMDVNPVYDRKNNRILFIYDLDNATHAVRGFQLPF